MKESESAVVSHRNERTYQDKEMRDHIVKSVNIRRIKAVKLPSIACE